AHRTCFCYFCLLCFLIRLSAISTLFPYTTLFRSVYFFKSNILTGMFVERMSKMEFSYSEKVIELQTKLNEFMEECIYPNENSIRSEEHTSELQSRFDLVCRLLLEKKQSDESDVVV